MQDFVGSKCEAVYRYGVATREPQCYRGFELPSCSLKLADPDFLVGSHGKEVPG